MGGVSRPTPPDIAVWGDFFDHWNSCDANRNDESLADTCARMLDAVLVDRGIDPGERRRRLPNRHLVVNDEKRPPGE